MLSLVIQHSDDDDMYYVDNTSSDLDIWLLNN